MREPVIHAERRTLSGTQACRRLRNKGTVPGVLYGLGEEGVTLAMNVHDLTKTLHAGAHIYDLKVEGLPDEKVLVKEVQYDSLGSDIVHVDLQRIALTETVEVNVPVVLMGHAAGVIHKGIVDQPLKELHVRCLATQIPHELRLVVTELEIGMMKTVKDVPLPEGVVATNPPDQVVVTVHPPAAEEVAEAVEGAVAEGPAEPEVIGAKPAEEGEEEAEEGKPEGKGEGKGKEPRGKERGEKDRDKRDKDKG
jgi:large subunit ribosomal protein L25